MLKAQRIKMRVIVPLYIQTFLVISTLGFYLVVVDSYIPFHRSKPLQKLSPLSVTSSSSSKPRFGSLAQEKDTIGGSSKDPSYIQWSHQNGNWKMQTAVTSFRRGNQTVELHAQQHYGDADYFRYWNSLNDFNKRHDCILFELLVDDELLEYKRGDWRVVQPIMASTNDQLFGQNLGLQCQASIIDYTNRKWAHADLSRQEFAKLAIENGKREESGNARIGNFDYTSTPLWKLASPESSSTAAEAVAALMVGPPTLDYSARKATKRRLFTNLFLPGGQLAFALRGILWMTVPAPELSIILLDWSSLLQGGSNPSALSEVALPILTSIVRFDINQLRRFLFGQVLISSNTSGNNGGGRNHLSSSWTLLVIDRNDHALNVLKRKLDERNVNSVALLYGSSHCPDLHNKLVQMGFQPMKSTWRTAWCVKEKSSTFTTAGNAIENLGFPALGAFLAFYLIIGALDWVGIVGDTSALLLDSKTLDASLEIGLYLIRHVLLYLGLSKFLVDWTNTSR